MKFSKIGIHITLENKLGHTDLYPLYHGYETCAPGKSFGPAVRRQYLIHYIVSGWGILEREGKRYPVRAGESFLIRPHEVTIYTADSADPWQYIWLGFDGALASQLDALPSPILPRGSIDLTPLVRAESEGRSVELTAIACLHLMMANLFAPARRPDYVTRVINDIEARYMEDVSVTSLAASIGLDRRYLSRLFRERCGVTLGQYIINVRIEKAKRLLDVGIPVLRVAELVGYSDYTTFSKIFRKRVGISPRAYLAEKNDIFSKNA